MAEEGGGIAGSAFGVMEFDLVGAGLEGDGDGPLLEIVGEGDGIDRDRLVVGIDLEGLIIEGGFGFEGEEG